ncbi:MAG: hypothetical protein HC873_23530, partial [Leptolyngbyaceae cyanobacterium SL_1_1]|nr:hypothetical protein [Leptolyngbyaceae cyanobacterium SL_1_1]
MSDRQGIVKTSDEQITLKAAPNAEGYLLQTGKKQKDVYLDKDLMGALGDEFYSVSDRMKAALPGSVAKTKLGYENPLSYLYLCSDAKDLMDEKDLSCHIISIDILEL